MRIATTLSAGLVALVLAAPAALADQVPRTEAGSVPLLTSAEEITQGPVSRGEIFATITGRPALVARIDIDVNTRTRPGPTPGPDAGSYLFGYQLASGVAYCEPLAASGMQQRRQCFRDFNDDSVFDGGYVTSRSGAALYFAEQVETLVPIAPLPYVAATPEDLPEVTIQLRLGRVAPEEARIIVLAGDDEWPADGQAAAGQENVFAFSFGTFRITWVEGDTYTVERIRSDPAAPADAAQPAEPTVTPAVDT